MLVQILFYAFATVLVASALGVIVSRNPVHSALSLVLCFITSAAIWLLIEAEFLAVVLVLVYVGAVMVLFLFVVMMLDINTEELRSGFTRYAWLGWVTAAVIIVEIVGVVTAKSLGVDVTKGAAPLPANYSNTTELGTVLYTKYAYPFELAAVLLLVAIVAAIALTMRKRPGHKVQDINKQNAARARDRVRIIKMDPVRPELPAASEAPPAEGAQATPEKGA
jgi:NADH-quinone oxidoreductase subunit J